MIKRLAKNRIIRDYAIIFIGTLITAIGLDAFLIPNKLAAGGASGLATIIFHLGLQNGVTIPVGIQTLVMNAILLFFVFRSGGLRYAAKTIFGIVVLSVAIDLFAPFIPNLSGHDTMLASIWGGVVTGFGLGLVFKVGGNTGGTDILAQLLSKKSSFGIGQLMLGIDAAVVVMAAFIFGPELALYAGIAIAIASWIIDLVIDGLSVEKAAWVISESYEALGEAIINDLGRGCTRIEGTGLWTGERRPVLFVVLTRKEVGRLKALVVDIDPNALVVISDVHEAFGEGFKEMGVE